LQPWMEKRLLEIQRKMYVTSLSCDASNVWSYARRNSTSSRGAKCVRTVMVTVV
jgi:hypothetical protein